METSDKRSKQTLALAFIFTGMLVINACTPNVSSWKILQIPDLEISFSYPETWGDGTIENASAEEGVAKRVLFSEGKEYFDVSYASTDFSDGREGSLAELLSDQAADWKVNNCEDLKKYLLEKIFVNNTEADVMENCHEVKNSMEQPAFTFITDSFSQKRTFGLWKTNNDRFPFLSIEYGFEQGQEDHQETIEKIFESISGTS